MKVLLVRPGYENLFANINIVNVEPLELEYLYTVTKEAGYDCLIYDAVIQRISFHKILKQYNPDIVAITGYITQRDVIIGYAKLAKEHNPAVQVIVGGVHAELNYHDFYLPAIDFIVHSGGIVPYREILNLPISGRKPGDIKGICYRSGDLSWVVNERSYIDPDQLPIPDRSFFYANQHHFKYVNLSPCATVKASYSCPHRCNFCYCCQLNNGKYVCRDVAKVVEEIAGIDCENIWILDDTFFVDRQKVQEFARLLLQQGIKKNFILYYRADFIAANEEVVAMLKEVGLKVVLVGLESFDDDILSDYNKLTSKAINERCLEILRKYEIDCTGLFIVDIDATKKDFKNLRDYVKKYQLMVSTAAILTPLPGTSQYEKYRTRINTDNPKHWDFLHLVAEPGNMSRYEFYFEFYKFYIKLLLINKKSGYLDVKYLQYIKNLIKGYISR